MVNINDRRLGLPILYFAAVTYRESYYHIPTELPQWQVLGAKTFLFCFVLFLVKKTGKSCQLMSSLYIFMEHSLENIATVENYEK